MHRALAAVATERAATPEQARRANADLRQRMRAAGNYFGDIEAAAAGLLKAIDHRGGPITRTAVDRLAAHLGFTLVHTSDLPGSTRSVTDLANRRIYLPQPEAGQHDSRSLALQALGHVVLDHAVPADYGAFLAQRVEINYFAAALLIPEAEAMPLLSRAKAVRDIAIEDLRDAYAVSYETAAHRFTNLATRHLDLPVHFMRISSAGVIYKAYENDGVHFPTDATGAIEGQRVCRYWTRQGGLRPAGPVARVPAVHGHRVGHLLVHGRDRQDAGRHLLGQRRRAVRAGQMDAWTRYHGAMPVQVPRSVVLSAAAGRPRPGGGTGWPGPAPGCTPTCWRPCRRASSRASTTQKCCNSWRTTPRPESAGPRRGTDEGRADAWHQGRPVAADHRPGDRAVHHVPGPGCRPAGSGLSGRVDPAALPPAGHRGRRGVVGRAGGVDRPRRRRRTEAGQAGHAGGLGQGRGKPGRRLVRPAQGLPRPVRHVPAAAPGGARSSPNSPTSPATTASGPADLRPAAGTATGRRAAAPRATHPWSAPRAPPTPGRTRSTGPAACARRNRARRAGTAPSG